MTVALLDATVEATGHPTECEEPVTGSIESAGSHNVTVTIDGVSKEIATAGNSSITFSSHSHDYTDADGCHQNESHSIDGSSSSSVTINGDPIYQVESGVATDPITEGNVNIVSNPLAIEIS